MPEELDFTPPSANPDTAMLMMAHVEFARMCLGMFVKTGHVTEDEAAGVLIDVAAMIWHWAEVFSPGEVKTPWMASARKLQARLRYYAEKDFGWRDPNLDL